MKRRVLILLLAACMLISGAGCGGEKEVLDYGFEKYCEPEEGEEIAIIKTNKGDIYLRLFPEDAPKAVENFVTHAKNGYFDGITFYRVIDDFMIQSGSPDGSAGGGESIWGESFENEFSLTARHFRGALSMANAGMDYTNGSQFFIVQCAEVSDQLLADMQNYPTYFSEEVIKKYQEYGGTPSLDFKHSVFGFVFRGMDVVDAIAAARTDSRTDKPVKDIVVKTVKIKAYSK